MTVKISTPTARKLVLRAQGLSGDWGLSAGKEGVAEAVERLGYVQIDTISVVQRAHHHTIWSRCPGYTDDMLHALQATDRRVFEYWTRAACYLPMRDYRYSLPRMRAVAKQSDHWLNTPEVSAVAEHVLKRIQEEGPLRSVDFKDTRKQRGSWWDWKPAKRALEHLFDRGKLMVSERRNFQRVYDLTERVLPPGVDTTIPTNEEVGRFVVRRVLRTKGFAASKEFRWERHRPQAVDGALRDLVSAGEVVLVRIQGIKEEAYAFTDDVEAVTRRSRRKKRVHILSPFDNAVIDRRRLANLFDFDYKLECYFPAAKRQYGYFCLPILWGSQFVGRIDAKADRKKKELILKTLMFEDYFSGLDGVAVPLAGKLRAFARFNGCERITIETCMPFRSAGAIEAALGLLS
jgi:uncharacterized protein YcaQ